MWWQSYQETEDLTILRYFFDDTVSEMWQCFYDSIIFQDRAARLFKYVQGLKS